MSSPLAGCGLNSPASTTRIGSESIACWSVGLVKSGFSRHQYRSREPSPEAGRGIGGLQEAWFFGRCFSGSSSTT